MASHRKPRTRIPQSVATSRGVLGVTTAALASVTLLSQSANATPADPADGPGAGSGKQSLSDVKDKVDALYRQAGTATQKYNSAREKTDRQRQKADGMLDQVAGRTAKVNDARRVLGTYAAAQYRTGGISPTATLLLTKDPQGFFKQTHLMDRMTGRQKEAVTEYQKRQKAAGKKRAEASRELSSLASSQKKLRSSKREIQSKLSEAREMLSKLTAQEKARLAEIERQKRAEARQKAKERAEQARREAARKERERRQGGGSDGGEQGGGSDPGTGTPDSSYSAKAQKVIAFAKKQLGKPYVWGATGPNSYDCSGLTQDAWKAGGVSLPRTTWDQVKVGTKVAKSAMKPGDLIFFYDDISHVGIYVGNGQMIHAPKPGANVRYESIEYMPFHSAVRPA
ncbi:MULTISPECIES: NlpC/P60 family protein [unclassified Streptomyces]|uniref:C40 family peptidase n=1 Tax=unclassified Streptomyces TaxID=2593676 RepID=UPI002DD8E794|nr:MULTISPECIES: NlpC/P60 family protein [unclassified Streptomyces]WSA92878.1 NlpC/P60 family protein [Streptomyces sp. NBC_01795]WSB77247.1 NlpC/P60 family protein [Streptomyces sp. NBC_01775]WSS14488.1 NlpC/P60 family protein [Streptomyces sp. NBC_01186]WSS43305.1 NlpC/P60 family protein [Streptomyces sp. NBC_01187]